MKLTQACKMAVRAIWDNKMRSFLTALASSSAWWR